MCELIVHYGSAHLSSVHQLFDLLLLNHLDSSNYTQKKKFSQYFSFLIKSTILDISLSNCIYESYYRSFTCIRLLCDK